MAKGKTLAVEHINYSFVPNHRETMQALAMANFTSYEFRVIVALMNQTDGYLREEDEISSTFWQALTLMPRQRVHEALHRLIEKGVIAKHDSYYRVRPPNEWPPQVFDQPRACKRATSIAYDLAQREREPHRYQWLRKILKPSPGDDAFEENRPPERTILEKPSARTDDSGAAGGENRPPERTHRPLERTHRPLERTNRSATADDLATPKERESPKESPKERGAKKNSFSRGDPRIKNILDNISQELGAEIPFYAKEGAFVKRALQMGFTEDQFIDCWRAMKKFSFWQGKWLPLAKVTENLDEFAKGRLADGTGRNLRASPTRRASIAHPEDLAKGW